MRSLVVPLIVASALAGAISSVALAAPTQILTNGGLGQSSGNTTSFNVAICNGGPGVLDQSVPILAESNGHSLHFHSSFPVAPGKCTYSNIFYESLGMVPGGMYAVDITIDPIHLFADNSDNKTSYTLVVPDRPIPTQTGGVEEPQAVSQAASINLQLGNFFTGVFHWFANLWPRR